MHPGNVGRSLSRRLTRRDTFAAVANNEIPRPNSILALQLSRQAENIAMKKAVEARPLPGYRIWLRYDDGVEGEVDLSYLAGRGVFKAWNDRIVFDGVHVDKSGAIAWNEDIDLCPDALYLRLTGKTVEELFPKLKTPVGA
jgi:hypothetical protein